MKNDNNQTGGRRMDKNTTAKIEKMMSPFRCVASLRDGYIRLWNCYCGSIMGGYNRKLDETCAALGMEHTRVRTVGDGRVNVADWEDQLRFV